MKGGNRICLLTSLLNFTDQGIRTVTQTLDRAERAAEIAQKHGARLERVYWTVGPYDLLAIIEAPDEESAAISLLEMGSWGNVRTTTLRAFEREAMSRIIERLGPS